MNMPNNYHDNDSKDSDLEYQQEWLSAYLDDELNAAQRALVEQRIAQDEQAAVMLQDLQRVRSLVGSLPAWSGNVLSLPDITRKLAAIPPAELVQFVNEQATDGPWATTANSQDNDGDYHNELNPGAQSQLSPASKAGVLEHEIEPDFSRGRRAGPTTGWSNTWLRPALLAASLLFALGLGILFWPANSPWSVATTTGERQESSQSLDKTNGPTETAADPKFAIESDALPAPAMPAAESLAEPAGQFSLGGLSDSSEPSRGAVFGSAGTELKSTSEEALGRSGSPPASSLALPKAEIRQELADVAQTNIQDRGQPAKAKELPLPGADAKAPSAELELQRIPIVEATASPAPLQLAHSTAWTDADIRAGLVRLSPFLNWPVDKKSESLSKEQRSAGRTGQITSAANEFPIAVLTRKRSERDGSQLAALLQQASFGLTGIAEEGSSRQIPGLTLFGAATATEPSTIALFVDRGLAQQILQAAEQAGEVSANPAWIMSVNSKDSPTNAAQKVVLLFLPQ